MSLKNFTFAQICQMIIVPAFFDTLKMLLISGFISTILGFVFGVILIVTEKGGLYENVVINRILDFIVNTIRSFPFIILMVSIIPFTRLNFTIVSIIYFCHFNFLPLHISKQNHQLFFVFLYSIQIYDLKYLIVF